MTAARPVPRYSDPIYQSAHDDTFSKPVVKEIETVLPPGVSQADFDGALREFREALGENGVFAGSGLKEYVDPYEIPESGKPRNVPSAAVWSVNVHQRSAFFILIPLTSPSSVEELQVVLKVANKYLVPVWTISRGKNLG